jgi:hypothetical protein
MRRTVNYLLLLLPMLFCAGCAGLAAAMAAPAPEIPEGTSTFGGLMTYAESIVGNPLLWGAAGAGGAAKLKPSKAAKVA